MNIAAKTFKDFVSSLKQASTKGFNKPVQINYQYGYFLAELQEGEAVDYKEKLNKLSGDETEHLFDVMNGLLEWSAGVTAKVVIDKPVEKEDIVIEREKPAVSMQTKQKRNPRKKV